MRVLTFMAAEELDGVDEPRVERRGPPHPRRPGAPLQPRHRRPGRGTLERVPLLGRQVASASGVVVTTRRRSELQAQARGVRAEARVCKEPYLTASFFIVVRRQWFRHRRRVRGHRRQAYLEGEIRQVPPKHYWKGSSEGMSQDCSYLNNQVVGKDSSYWPIH
jgi:hypothetical protein